MLSRRNLLNSTLGAGLALATQGLQQTVGQAPSAQGGRKRIIVDAQIHLWKADSKDWNWVPVMEPQLPEPFTIERALRMMDEAGVDRAVVVPPSWPGDRNDFGIEAASAIPTASRSWAASHSRIRNRRSSSASAVTADED